MIIPARREQVLRAVHRLTVELRRPPLATEVARELGTDRQNAWSILRRARRDGQVMAGSRRSVFTAGCVRLTPAAMVTLGIPPIVYLAWPVDWDSSVGDDAAAAGADWARHFQRAGLTTVSPLFVSGCRPPGGTRAAEALARAADAVVVVADQLLLGRSDVIAAHLAAVPVAFVEDPSEVSSAEKLWLPPRLVPEPDPSGR